MALAAIIAALSVCHTRGRGPGDIFPLIPRVGKRIMLRIFDRKRDSFLKEQSVLMSIKSGNIKKIAFLVILVVLIALFTAGWFVMNRETGNKIITGGDRAPEFHLKTLDGGSVSLAELRGKVVMVHFWATWCPPCVEEIPTLDRLHHSPMGKDFEMLAVNEDEGGEGAVASFLQQNKLNLPVLVDTGSDVARRYGTYKLPETYIVDRQGVVRYKAIGPRDWTDPASIQIVQNIIGAR
jgi:peroxiredoxin